MRMIDAEELMEHVYRDKLDSRELIANMVKNAPTIEERKTGEWIPRCDRSKQEVFICSECGRFAYSPWTGSRKTPKKNWCKYRFCPNCGADMRGDHHETP